VIELDEKALISRLWAQYNGLPETFKKAIYDIAQSLALEAGKQKNAKKGEIKIARQ
jgi:hypothetical protein